MSWKCTKCGKGLGYCHCVPEQPAPEPQEKKLKQADDMIDFVQSKEKLRHPDQQPAPAVIAQDKEHQERLKEFGINAGLADQQPEPQGSEEWARSKTDDVYLYCTPFMRIGMKVEAYEAGWNASAENSKHEMNELESRIGDVELDAYAKGKKHSDERYRELVEEITDELQKMLDWCNAYPIEVFPEPDFKKAAQVLKDAGMTIDSISASNMRHVLKGLRGHIEAALEQTKTA